MKKHLAGIGIFPIFTLLKITNTSYYKTKTNSPDTGIYKISQKRVCRKPSRVGFKNY